MGGRIALLCAMIAMASAAAQPADRRSYAIVAKQVVDALAGQGIQVTAGQVVLLADMVASRPDAELEVLAIGPPAGTAATGRGARSWVKLGCRAPGTCLPFYALVAMDSAGNSTRPMPGKRERRRGASERSAIVMRAGTRATLELVGPEARIEVAVISLESGAMGRRIRVATPDYKQFYRAEIVGADRLKGGL